MLVSSGSRVDQGSEIVCYEIPNILGYDALIDNASKDGEDGYGSLRLEGGLPRIGLGCSWKDLLSQAGDQSEATCLRSHPESTYRPTSWFVVLQTYLLYHLWMMLVTIAYSSFKDAPLFDFGCTKSGKTDGARTLIYVVVYTPFTRHVYITYSLQSERMLSSPRSHRKKRRQLSHCTRGKTTLWMVND